MAAEGIGGGSRPPDENDDYYLSRIWSTAPALQTGSSAMQAKFRDAYQHRNDPPVQAAYKPCRLFVYGTLSLPHILQKVLGLPSPPVLTPASIRGYRVKMWGPYPAVITCTSELDSLVHGKVYMAETEEHLRRLRAFEGENYRLTKCMVELGSASGSVEGCTFVWNGYEEELEEGVFEPGHFPVHDAGHRFFEETGESSGK